MNAGPGIPGDPSRDEATPEAVVRFPPRFREVPPMRYQDEYVWFVFFATLDVVLTWHILERQHGTEVNPIAGLVIFSWGYAGAVAFKYALVLLVIVACEIVGRQRDRSGRRLIRLAVIVSFVPVLWSLSLLALQVAQRRGWV